MTIQEAIKSGKPFRRLDENVITHKWIRILGHLTGRIHWLNGEIYDVGLNFEDILAEDWEIKE